MLMKNPKDRISCEGALSHSWFTQDQSEMNDQKLDFANVQKEEENAVVDIDYAMINDCNEEELKLVTCTPIMAKRKLNTDVPETPFLTANKINKSSMATPLMKGGIVIQKAGAPKIINMKGIAIKKPGSIPQTANNSKIAQIPLFKGKGKAAPGSGKPQLGGGLGGGLGRGKGGLSALGGLNKPPLKLGSGGGLGLR